MVPYQHESSVVPHATVECNAQKRGIFDTITEAVEHGYRTCKRCKPEKSSGWNKSREFINKSCSMISRRAINGEKLNIDTIIAAWVFLNGTFIECLRITLG